MSRILLGKYDIECPDEGCSKAIIRKAKRQGAIDELNSFYGEVIDGRFSGLMILEKKALRDYVEKRLVELRKE